MECYQARWWCLESLSVGLRHLRWTFLLPSSVREYALGASTRVRMYKDQNPAGLESRWTSTNPQANRQEKFMLSAASQWHFWIVQHKALLYVKLIQCISLLGLRKQRTTDWVASTTEIYLLVVLVVEVQNQGVGRIGSFWKLSGLSLTLSLACRRPSSLYIYHLIMFPLTCVSMFKLSLFIRTPIVWD